MLLVVGCEIYESNEKKEMTYEAPKYPPVKFEDDRRRKLSKDDIEEIKSLRVKGWSYKKIGQFMGVSGRTAQYHSDPSYKEKSNKYRYGLLKKQLAGDPELRAKRQREKLDFLAERRINDPEFRDFKNKHTYKWKKKRYHTDPEFKKKTRLQALEKYHRDMETQPEKLKERWRRSRLKKSTQKKGKS